MRHLLGEFPRSVNLGPLFSVNLGSSQEVLNIIIHFQIKLKNFLGPKILSTLLLFVYFVFLYWISILGIYLAKSMRKCLIR